jgi:predicted nucleotidyltransferase
MTVSMDDTGLPSGCLEDVIAWARENGSVSELWLFGSRGPKGGAREESDVDLGIALRPKVGDTFGNYVALGAAWQTELEGIVGRHVSLVPMVPGNKGNAIIRSTGVCLWRVRSLSD